MELMPGYKQTEVGVIPDDWDVSTVGREFEIKLGKMLDAERNTGVPKPYLGNKAVQWGRINFDDLPTVPMTRADIYSYRLREGDLLVCEGGEVGRAAIWHGPIDECYYQKAIHRLRALNGFEPSLMVGLLRRWADSGRLANYVTKTSIAHLPREKFLAITMPVPPQAEQRLISQVLCDLDALVAQLDGLIAKKRNIKQAAMQELLTGKRRLKGFGPTRSFKRYEYGLIPEDWNIELLRKISTMSGRIGWQGLKQEEFTDNPEDPFLITGMNFKEGKIDWSNIYHIPDKRYLEAPPIQLKRKDILMTKDGTIGKLLYVEAIPHPGKASLNSHLLVLRPVANKYAPEFLYHQLASPYFASHIEINKSGSTFFGLTQAAAGKYPVVLPSIDEQLAIGRALLSIDDAIDQLQHRLEKTQLLKAGILHELLTGRTRLK